MPALGETFDRDRLRTRILQKARVDVEGQTASARQEADADNAIDPAIAELYQRRIADLDLNSGIPISLLEHLAEFCLFFSAKDFGIQPDAAMKEYAEASMRAILSRGPTYEDQRVDFMMRGPAGWDDGEDYDYLRDYL